jgi:hypothetical protein
LEGFSRILTRVQHDAEQKIIASRGATSFGAIALQYEPRKKAVSIFRPDESLLA